jgi:hypothetical protein
MKKNALLTMKGFILPIMAVLLLSFGALAQPGQIRFTGTAPNIDGTVDAIWDDAVDYPIQNKLFADFSYDDFSATWKGLWDKDNLYLMVEVKNSKELVTVLQNNWWEDDVVEVYVDGDNAKGTTYRAELDYQFGFRYNDPGVRKGTGVKDENIVGIKHAYVATAGGYNMEISIPWASLGMTSLVEVGHILGFDVQPNWGKGLGKLLWNDTKGQAWNNPSLMGEVVLAPKSPGRINFASSVPVINGNIDAAWDNAVVYPIENKLFADFSYDDFSATWKGLWDNDNLYLMVEVKNSKELVTVLQNNWWEDDVVEVYIDGDNAKGTTYRAELDYQFGFRYNDPGVRKGTGVKDENIVGIKHAYVATAGGYNMEISIPWASLGMTSLVEVGHILGFDVQPNWGKGLGKLLWHDTKGQAWNNPSLMGEVKLVASAGPEPLRLPEVVRESFDYTAGEPLLDKGAAGNGWAAPWVWEGGDATKGSNLVQEDNLELPGFASKGNKVLLHNNRLIRELEHTWPDEAGREYWVSFMWQRTDTDASQDGGSYGGIALFMDDHELVSMGKPWNLNTHGLHGAGPSGSDVSTHTLARLVVKVVMNGTDAPANIYAWVNPDPNVEPDVTTAHASTLANRSGGFNKIRVAAGNDGLKALIDEIYLSESYEKIFTPLAGLPELVHESFDYPVGAELLGLGAAGNGWGGPWNWEGGDAAGSNEIQAGSLNVQNFRSEGNKVFLHNNRLIRDLDQTWPDEAGRVYWISFMWQRTDNFANRDGGSYGGIALFKDGDELFSAGKPWFVNYHGLHGTQNNYDYSDIATQELVRMVIKIEMNGTDDPDPIYAWINPDPNVEPSVATADAESIAKSVGGFNKIRVATGNDETTVLIDEIFLSETYSKIFRSSQAELYALTLAVNPAAVGVITGAGSYAKDAQVQLTATANENYEFVNWTNAANEVVSTQASFAYTMPAAQVTLTANFRLRTSVEELESLVKVYPNPADNFLYVENLSGSNNIRISNIVGQVVRHIDTQDSLFGLNISDLEKGVYFLQITNEKGVKIVEKFVKK